MMEKQLYFFQILTTFRNCTEKNPAKGLTVTQASTLMHKNDVTPSNMNKDDGKDDVIKRRQLATQFQPNRTWLFTIGYK